MWLSLARQMDDPRQNQRVPMVNYNSGLIFFRNESWQWTCN